MKTLPFLLICALVLIGIYFLPIGTKPSIMFIMIIVKFGLACSVLVLAGSKLSNAIVKRDNELNNDGN